MENKQVGMYTMPEAAKLLGISYQKLREMVSKDQIKYVLFPDTGQRKTIRIKAEHLDEFINENLKGSNS